MTLCHLNDRAQVRHVHLFQLLDRSRSVQVVILFPPKQTESTNQFVVVNVLNMNNVQTAKLMKTPHENIRRRLFMHDGTTRTTETFELKVVM